MRYALLALTLALTACASAPPVTTEYEAAADSTTVEVVTEHESSTDVPDARIAWRVRCPARRTACDSEHVRAVLSPADPSATYAPDTNLRIYTGEKTGPRRSVVELIWSGVVRSRDRGPSGQALTYRLPRDVLRRMVAAQKSRVELDQSGRREGFPLQDHQRTALASFLDRTSAE